MTQNIGGPSVNPQGNIKDSFFNVYSKKNKRLISSKETSGTNRIKINNESIRKMLNTVKFIFGGVGRWKKW